jgi:hypothetical protein
LGKIGDRFLNIRVIYLKGYMKVVLTIPYRKGSLNLSVYKIPAWLVAALVIVAMIALTMKLRPFNL